MIDKGARTILVIEDFADSRLLLSSLLRAKGYKVVEACDGREGLLQANRVPPDLILMDLAMPRLDGVAATRELRKRQTLALVPIFAISAYATRDVKQDALAAGCTEVFPKPLEMETFLGRIKEALDA
jgi:CheY-like chemotaxis protein